SSEHRGLLAFEWLPGRLLMDLCHDAELDRDALGATGEALAALHAQRPEGLAVWSREAEAADVLALGAELGFLCPRLASRTKPLPARRDCLTGSASISPCNCSAARASHSAPASRNGSSAPKRSSNALTYS